MKQSLALAIAILALGAAPAFFQQQRLANFAKITGNSSPKQVSSGSVGCGRRIVGEPRLTKRERDGSKNIGLRRRWRRSWLRQGDGGAGEKR